MKRVLVGALGIFAFVACGREAGITSPERDASIPSSFAAVGTDPVSGARIETNKDDYVPGELVHVVGSGWAPNETVHLFMSEQPDTHPDIAQDVVADGTGAFSIHFYDVQTYDIDVVFTLTATGAVSASVATAIFYDGNVNLLSTAPVVDVVSYAITFGSSTCAASPAFTTAVAINFSGAAPHSYPECTEVRAPSSVVVSSTTYTFDGWLVVGLQGSSGGPPSTISTTTGTVGTDQWLKFIAPGSNTVGTITAKYKAPTNTPPIVTITGNPPYSGNEGTPINVSGTATDPDVGGSIATTLWTVTGVPVSVTCTFAAAGDLNTTITCTDNFAGTVTVTLTATDNNGASTSLSTTLTISNVASSITAGAATESINEGDTFSRSGSFIDPGADIWTATVDYDDGNGPVNLALTPGKTFNLSHTYPQDGVFTVTVTVTDDDGGSDTETITVTVANVLPTVLAGADVTINEGDTFTRNGSFIDPGADSWTATVDYGEGGGPQALALSGKSFTLNHTYADDDGQPFTITVKVFDDDGNSTDLVIVNVNNLPPVISSVVALPTAAGNIYPITQPVTIKATYSDVGVPDTHTCSALATSPNLADVTGTTGTGVGSNPNRTCSSVLTFVEAGVYDVDITVTDDDGGSATTSIQVVIYDPSAGFVTGGGWIDAAPGSYTPNPSLSGKGTFGFVSKYVKTQSTPTGNTQFVFHAGGFNFHSIDYQFLIVNQNATNAQFKGTGQVEGSSTIYNFMLWATDGSLGDRFRIKIWEADPDNPIFDNMLGQVDGTLPQAIANGAIQIHAPKK